MLKELYYFTDGSMIPHSNLNGIAGFIVMDLNYYVISNEMFVGYANIHYLEALAIYYALEYIERFMDYNNKHVIYTDSNTCYNLIKKVIFAYYDQTPYPQYYSKPKSIAHTQIIFTSNLLINLLNKGLDIRLLCIKSHANPKEQKSYLKQQDIEISLRGAKLICYGNSIIDHLVHTSLTIFQQDYPYPIIEQPVSQS